MTITKQNEITKLYDNKFFEDNLQDGSPVANYLAPIIAEKLNLKTVVDLGCATGHWLKAFQDAGMKIHGIEGSLAAKDKLLVNEKYVTFTDLRQCLSADTDAPGKSNLCFSPVDLVTSIEVAEHIEPQFADVFVSNLTNTFKPKHIIMTAAAIGQGGRGHYNERHSSYWIAKLFAKGYTFDPQLKDFLTIKVIEGRQWSDCPEHLKAPDRPWAREEAHPTIKGYDGVWIPFWLPSNLLCFKRTVK